MITDSITEARNMLAAEVREIDKAIARLDDRRKRLEDTIAILDSRLVGVASAAPHTPQPRAEVANDDAAAAAPVVAPKPARAKPVSIRPAILAEFQRYPDTWMSIRDVARAIHHKELATRAAVEALRRQGDLSKATSYELDGCADVAPAFGKPRVFYRLLTSERRIVLVGGGSR